MTVATEEMIQDMVAAVVREVDPVAVILFGSRASGNASADSDVDLLIVAGHEFGPHSDRRKEMARIWGALAGFGVAKDILLYSMDEVEHWRLAVNHVIALALREGKILYGSI